MLRELITINPRPAIRANPRKRRRSSKRRRARRNPRFGLPSMSTVTNTLMPAVIGGVGALSLDLALSWVPFVPEDWKVGWRRTAVRAGAALAIGFGARQFLPARMRGMVGQAIAGALVVTAYDAAKKFAAENFPDLALGAYYDDGLSAYTRVSYDALPTISRVRNGGGDLNAYVAANSDGGMLAAVR